MNNLNLSVHIIILSLTLILVGCSQNSAEPRNQSEIISLSPHITEIVYALGMQDRLLAVTDFCNYPIEAKTKPSIGGLVNPNIEKMISLRPDYLIGMPSNAELAAKLSTYQLPLIMLPNNEINEIFTSIDSIAALLNATDRGDSLLKSIQDSISHYQQLSRNLLGEGPRVMFVLGRERGTTRNISIIGPDTFTDELLQMTGAQNAFSQINNRYAQINRESLLQVDPDLIIEFKFNQVWTDQMVEDNLKEWNDLPELQAVQTRSIYVIDGNYSLIPGPRVYLLVKDYYNILLDWVKN